MSSILGLALLVVGVILVLKIAGGLLGLVVALVVAACIGFGAEALVPGDRMPHGWLPAIGAGLVGSWVGNVLFGRYGPRIDGFAIVPAILGAMIVVAVVTLVSRRNMG